MRPRDEQDIDDIRVASVSPDGEVVIRWAGGSFHLRVPESLAHYYRRLVPNRTPLRWGAPM